MTNSVQQNHIKSLLNDPNKSMWLYIGLGALLTILVVVYKAHTRWIPDTATYIAAEIPQEIYHTIGEQTLKSLDEESFKPSELSEDKQSQVRTEFNQLLKKLLLEDNKYQLQFRAWSKGMNAFALMDGTIVVTDDLVNQLENPQQLNSVLLHEIGHISQNHLMENTIRVSIFYVTLSLIFGDISIVSDLLIEASTMGANLGFSREFELQADAFAAKAMIAQYGSIEQMVMALEKLEKAHQETVKNAQSKDEMADENDKEESQDRTAANIHPWLTTHPPTDKRIEHIQSIAKTLSQ